MSLLPIVPPAIEPISIAEAKAHLRVDGGDEDTLIAALITTSRLQAEAAIARVLITQSWSYVLDRWPAGGSVDLPLGPVQSVIAVRTYRADDTAEVVASDSYQLDGAGMPARLVRRAATAWPSPGRQVNGVEIQFVAGYGSAPADVPAPIRQALLLLVAHWYEQREPIATDTPSPGRPILAGVGDLLAPYRMVRL